MESSILEETIEQLREEIRQLRADTARLEARLGADVADHTPAMPRRMSRGGMIRAAAAGVAGIGAIGMMQHEAQPALADTIGNFISTNPGSDAVHATSTAGAAGVHGIDTSNAGGIGVKGESSSGYGGHFKTYGGTGLHGESSGVNPGIFGTNTGSGPSIFGDAGGSGPGVSGRSKTSYGVEGIGLGNHGVHGQTFQADQTASSKYYFGVFGENSANGTGIYGVGSIGVNGTGTNTGIYGATSNSDAGLQGNGVHGVDVGTGTANYGVKGESANGTGGYFTSPGGTGLHGDSGSAYPAVYGTNNWSGPSVFGDSTGIGAGASGRSSGGNGIEGFAGSPTYPGQGYGGRFGISTDALAQLLLTPAATSGHPTTQSHQAGEIFMDAAANLWVCVAGGASGGTWKQVSYSPFAATDARIRHFTITRRAEHVEFHWRMADGKGIAGFELYAAGHRLNRETIRPHRAKTYDASATWKGAGAFALHVLFRDGAAVVVHPE